MKIHIECEGEGDLVTVVFVGSTATQMATFVRSNWLSSCGCIATLLETIAERDSAIKMYKETVAALTGKGG